MDDTQNKHWGIANNLDTAAYHLNQLEAAAWHGMRNRDHRTKAETAHDFDLILVEVQKIKACLGVCR